METTEIKLEQKLSIRHQSLQTAERLQPNSSLSNWGALAGQSGNNEKDVTKLLADAETIYNWLIKYL